jgi:hypothetical protein
MPKALKKKVPFITQPVERHIRLIRGQRVMLDSDLAALYQVSTKALNQAVRRNIGRFPDEFMFQLTVAEASALRSQIVTLEKGRGRYSKYAPLVFTEHGVVMLSSVLSSERAVQMNIMVVRAFLRLRELIASSKDIAARIEKLETDQRHTASIIEVLVDEIDSIARDVRGMKTLSSTPKRKIGFDL